MNDEAQEMQSRSWLCIAYAFPPIRRSGTHRPAAFVRGLAEHGWRANVLTVQAPPEEAIDHRLLDALPAETTIHKAAWFRPLHRVLQTIRSLFPPSPQTVHSDEPSAGRTSDTHRSPSWRNVVSSIFRTPDSRIGWVVPAVVTGLRSIRRKRPEVLFSTSPYASAHLIGLVLNRLTHIPWVADFRDPWCGNPFDAPKPFLADRLNRALERAVLRRASAIVCNSPAIGQSMVDRHPEVRAKLHVIMNGVDSASVAKLLPRRAWAREGFVLSHCGQFYGPRSPAFLFRALRALRNASPTLAAKLRLALIGPTNCQRKHLADLAREHEVVDSVVIVGERPHAQALELSLGSDALLLIGAAGPGESIQIPQKLYEYLALRKPILALVGGDNPVRNVLKTAGADALVCNPEDVEAIASALAHLADPNRRPAGTWENVGEFDRAARVRELATLFDMVAQNQALPRRAATTFIQCESRPLDEYNRPSMIPV